nr:ATP-binding protein [Cytobacillus firmus]
MKWQKKTLDMLRQPLETGKVTINRVHSTVTYLRFLFLLEPLSPVLAAAVDPHIIAPVPKSKFDPA